MKEGFKHRISEMATQAADKKIEKAKKNAKEIADENISWGLTLDEINKMTLSQIYNSIDFFVVSYYQDNFNDTEKYISPDIIDDNGEYFTQIDKLNFLYFQNYIDEDLYIAIMDRIAELGDGKIPIKQLN